VQTSRGVFLNDEAQVLGRGHFTRATGLVRDGEVVGVSNLRHRLTRKLKLDGGSIGYGIRPSARGHGLAAVLLGRTLDRARSMGLREAWVTCAKTNLASAATIARNGGTLMSEAFIESRGEVVQRYKIELGGRGGRD